MKLSNELGFFDSGGVVRWTAQAIQCYKNGGVCAKCEIPKITNIKSCKMKACVLELVKRYGKPESEEE